ncbi:hypothetical protein [Shewanella phage SFCi1]|nr:hypothetical protein [Shewanella phage SFCi1]
MKITIVSSTKPSTLTKHISRAADGALVKSSSAHMTQGHAQVADVGSMAELNATLDQLQPNQAIAYGTPSVDSAPLVSERYLASTPGAITRSDKFFSWPKGGGFMMLDYDPVADGVSLSRDALLGALFSILPAASSCGWLWRPSASGNIYDAQTGAELAGLKGQRVYLAVADIADAPRAGGVLFKRAWLAGHGRIELAQNGAQLVRALVDASVWQPSRLDFAAGAVCAQGLERRPPAGLPVEGGLLDTKQALPDLTMDEERKYAELVHAAKGNTQQASAQQREKHVHTVAEQQGVSPEEIRARYDVAEEKGVLANDFQIELAYGRGVVTVADILCNPEEYHNAVCLDPLEPDYNNRHPVGKIYNDSKGAYLDSKAHGGRIFSLGSIAALVFQEQASNGSTFKDLMSDIRTDSCDLAEVQQLVARINDGPFCEQERVLLRAEMEGNLKEAKRLTPEVKAMLHGGDASKPDAPRARDYLPDSPAGRVLGHDTPLHPSKWAPYQTTGKDEKPKGTLSNFRVMAAAYGVRITFNEISKDMTVDVPCQKKGGALKDEASLGHLISLANLNSYPKGDVPAMACSLADENTVNPVTDWLRSSPWDGVDRIGELFNQIQFSPGEDIAFCELLFRRWVRGAAAVGTGQINGFECALVLVDEKGGAGKTRFFRTFCPPELRADGLSLDLSDKDSIKTAISKWLVELGELDGTFKKSDIAHLKAFLSNTEDEIRLPYARTYSKFARRTAFMASVNQINFLADETDNRRFWAMQVEKVNHEHNVNMQQVWAQAAAEAGNGMPCHLNDEEGKHNAIRNRGFRAVSRVEDMLSARVDFDNPATVHMTCSELATACGLNNAHKGELNEVARWLRENGVTPVVRKGKRGFMLAPLLPMFTESTQPQLTAVK